MTTSDDPHVDPGAPGRLHALVIDDEKNIRTTLSMCLESAGCKVTTAARAEDARAACARERVDIAFLDLRLGDEDGLELLPTLIASSPGVAVIVVTAYATVDSAVLAMKRGAFDYLPKPFSPSQIRHHVDLVREHLALRWRVVDLEGRLSESAPEVDLVSRAPAMQSVLEIIGRAASAEAPVLLRGENGTGKGVLARVLHQRSARSARPFITVNCPTLSDELLASELFGHTKGAFTGAVKDQPGRVEAAEGGTLFLDEIGEISTALQAKLLRFLQDHEFERIGDSKSRRADVRIIAATNRDIEADVKSGRFREDLLYRLNVLEVTVPPLRERREDIVALARHFLAFAARAQSRASLDLSRDAEEALVADPWPGNVRELKNVMERVAILWPAALVEPAALPARMRATTAAAAASAGARVELGGDVTLEQIDEEHIRRVTARAHTQEEAARILGVDASTLWRKRRKLKLD